MTTDEEANSTKTVLTKSKQLVISPRKKTGKKTGLPKGCTNNPNGRPKGTGYLQMIIAKLPENSVEALLKFVQAKAFEGDMTAAKIVLDRVLPIRRGARIELKLPPIDDLAAVSKARMHTMEMTSDGVISLEECQMTMDILESNCKLIMEEQILPRIEKLELLNGIKSE